MNKAIISEPAPVPQVSWANYVASVIKTFQPRKLAIRGLSQLNLSMVFQKALNPVCRGQFLGHELEGLEESRGFFNQSQGVRCISERLGNLGGSLMDQLALGQHRYRRARLPTRHNE
jgi:hypothetical protein